MLSPIHPRSLVQCGSISLRGGVFLCVRSSGPVEQGCAKLASCQLSFGNTEDDFLLSAVLIFY